MKLANAILALLALLALLAVAASDTAPFGALRSSSPVVTNEIDAAFLDWYARNHILLGRGAATADPEAPWPYHDIAIGADALTSEGGVVVGNAATSSVWGVAIGAHSYAGPHGYALGREARAGQYGVAIGRGAEAPAIGSVQIGQGRNDEAGTVRILGWPLLDERGNIPPQRLGAVPMRARLYSGATVVVDPSVSLYWCTNMTGSTFPVSVDLPDDADALRFDLWITVGVNGLTPSLVPGVLWAGPYGPPAAWAPGETAMLGVTAVRAASGDVLLVAEYRGAIPASPSGAVPAPPRTPGSVRVAASAGRFVQADGSADIYTMSLGSSATFAVAASIPAGSGGISGEVWISNVSASYITPACGNTLVGAMPSIPPGGRCIVRFRSIPAGPHNVETVVTVEGVTGSSSLLSMSPAAPSALSPVSADSLDGSIPDAIADPAADEL